MDKQERHASGERKVLSILETLDTVTGERTVLCEREGRIEAPNWTRDGRLVYNAEGFIWLFDRTKGTHERLASGFVDRCNNDHVLSPDGTRIAVSHHTAEDGRSRVYILPLSGGSPALITPMGPSYLHGWSPDGKTLAYCAERGGEYDVYTIPAVGGVETRLTDAPGLNDGPEYAPDGKAIWFNSVRTGLMQVYRMDADGANQTQMTFDEDANSWFPHVSPDGKWVVYIAYRKDDVQPGDHPADKDVEIRMMPAGGGKHQTLARLFGGQGTLNVNSWAPDSRHIAFVSYR